jgi:hypothetical protein
MYYKSLIKGLIDSFSFAHSLKANSNNQLNEYFTLTFGKKQLIENYYEKEAVKDQLELKEDENKAIVETKIKFKGDETVEESVEVVDKRTSFRSNSKILKKEKNASFSNLSNLSNSNTKSTRKLTLQNNKLDTKKDINNKPKKSLPPSIKSTQNKSDPSLNKNKSSMLDIDSTNKNLNNKKNQITKIKNLTKNFQDEFKKNRKNDEMLEACTDELDKLMKEVSNDLKKIGKNDMIEIDYAKLNREKKKKSSNFASFRTDMTEKCENEDKGKPYNHAHGHAHGHAHSSINIIGNYDNVAFKRVCLSDLMKK